MYKTNEEQEILTINEFKNDWWEKVEYLLVDIREEEEIESEGGVMGAYNISMYEIPDKIEMAPTWIICLLVCQDGSKSEQLVKYMKNNNYNNMFSIEGGVNSLVEAFPELRS